MVTSNRHVCVSIDSNTRAFYEYLAYAQNYFSSRRGESLGTRDLLAGKDQQHILTTYFLYKAWKEKYFVHLCTFNGG